MCLGTHVMSAPSDDDESKKWLIGSIVINKLFGIKMSGSEGNEIKTVNKHKDTKM